MSLRHLFSPRLRGSLLLGSLLVASSFTTQAAEELLRKAVGKGAYEMAYSNKRTRCGWRPHRAANWIPAGWFTALTRSPSK
ncbi:FIG00509962: hypothetical protein [Citrobacter freundii]|uniref:Uncharacterized protein n=1 Tax=Citrobacter freundii TaxID=546 RepID=A0A7G2ITL7_CITFR|nr:FIG00509962: hypothetical protein [Citrobacter freundii]